MHDQWTDLCTLLDERRALLDRLLELARRQRALIEEGRGEVLLQLLTARQEMVDALIATDARLQALTGDLGAWMRGLPEDQRHTVQEKVAAVEQRLTQIATIDEEDQRRLEETRDALRGQMQDVDRGRSAANAYRRPAAGPRYADRRG